MGRLVFLPRSFWLLCWEDRWKYRSRETSQEAVAVSRSERSVSQTRVVAVEGIKKWPVSILKVKPTGIPNAPVVGSKKNRRFKDNSKLLAWLFGKMTGINIYFPAQMISSSQDTTFIISCPKIIMMLNSIIFLLSSYYMATHFLCIIAFNPKYTLWVRSCYLVPFSRWVQWGSEKLNKLSSSQS